VALPEATPVLAPVPLAELPRAQARLAQDARAVRDDDDQIADDTAITEQLSFGGQLEAKWEKRDEYDLDKSNPGDRVDRSASLRGEFTWEAEDGEAFGLFGFRGQWSDERRDGDVDSHSTDGVVTELYGYWRDPLGGGVDLQVGRQDFDEPREWLYDENLDALRAIWRGLGARLELSASTVRSDGSPKNREYDNLIAYLSNGDWHRHVAAYVIARSDHDGAQRDEPVHLGVRALGAWLPDQDVWLEASWLRGRADDDVERHGFGVDVGSTWEPGLLEPFYLTAGWARGSGDRDPDNSVDGSFLQTGLQDNNSKFGGVTSFRYYGEVLDPELANLQVYTLGVGVRPDPDVSVDLVWHGYAQPVPTPQLINTNLKQQPDGVHSQLGDGLDLIFGWRHGRRWDVEVVLGTFDPGAAFPGEDRAYLTSFQFRWRF
jgi:alginate production protein